MRRLDLKASLEAGFDFGFFCLSDLADEDDTTDGALLLPVVGSRRCGTCRSSGFHHAMHGLHHQGIFSLEVQNALDSIEAVAFFEKKRGKPGVELALVDGLLNLNAHRLQVDVVMV